MFSWVKDHKNHIIHYLKMDYAWWGVIWLIKSHACRSICAYFWYLPSSPSGYVSHPNSKLTADVHHSSKYLPCNHLCWKKPYFMFLRVTELLWNASQQFLLRATSAGGCHYTNTALLSEKGSATGGGGASRLHEWTERRIVLHFCPDTTLLKWVDQIMILSWANYSSLDLIPIFRNCTLNLGFLQVVQFNVRDPLANAAVGWVLDYLLSPQRM